MPNSAEKVRKAQASIAYLARSEMAAAWPKLAGLDPARLAPVLAQLTTEIADKYGPAAASLAADYYDELRAAARVPGSFSAIAAELPDASRFEALSRWGVGPLFGAEPNADLALSQISGGLSRIIADAGRDTIAQSVAADPADAKYARHASANACAFCAMLAMRGPVYSEASATTVGGRGKALSTNIGRTRGAQAKGIRARGTQALGSKYHDHCHCTAVPVWPGQDYEEAPYVAKWRDAYRNAPAPETKGGAIDLKKTLASMREDLGTS